MSLRPSALLLFLLTLAGCRPAPAPERTPIVARWGTTAVTASDFEASYLGYWQTTGEPDSPALRARVARQLLEQSLIADSARHAGLADDPGLRQRIQRDFKRYTRARYLEETVQQAVPTPTDAEVEQAVRRQQQRFYIRQLFALTPEGIDSLANRLAHGEAFEDLARTTLPDPAMASAGGVLGWVGWGETDLPVEETLYNMKPGEISVPVQSLMGWHILRVDSVEQTIRFGDDDPKLRSDTREQLRNRRFDLAAAHHIRDYVWSHDLAVDRRALREVWVALAPLLPRRPTESLPLALEQAAEAPPAGVADRVVARVAGTPFTARQLFEALPDLPRGYLGPDLKQALEIAIRDSLLAEKALQAGFGEYPSVKEKTRRAEISYLFNAFVQAEAEGTLYDEPALRAFHQKYQPRYLERFDTEVWEILVASPDSARALAQRIEAGADFDALARRLTLRDSTRDAGGYLGFVSSTSGPIGAQAATMPAGGLFAPVMTPAGASIIKTGIRLPLIKPFEAVRDQVAQDARAMAFQEAVSRLLPPGYRPEDVVIDEAALAQAFADQVH